MLGYFCLIFLIILYKVDFFFENVYFIYFNIFTCLFGFNCYLWFGFNVCGDNKKLYDSVYIFRIYLMYKIINFWRCKFMLYKIRVS